MDISKQKKSKRGSLSFCESWKKANENTADIKNKVKTI